MDELQDKDLIRLKELLRRTGEFIAYFELAERKMLEWRHEIEQQMKTHHQQANQQLHHLQHELDALKESLTEAGLARLKLSTEHMMNQGQTHINLLRQTGEQLLAQMQTQCVTFGGLVDSAQQQLMAHSTQAMHQLDTHLGQYDPQQFNRIADESCNEISRSAHHLITNGDRLLRSFQWRSAFIALLITVVSTVALGLYVSNEMPWEIHQHALNEREAGKLLIKAWPNLTQLEKERILNNTPIDD